MVKMDVKMGDVLLEMSEFGSVSQDRDRSTSLPSQGSSILFSFSFFSFKKI